MPNICRRFLEVYLSFKDQSPHNIDQTIDKLIDDPVNCERVRKYVYYYSHALSTTRTVVISDFSECKSVVDTILKAVEVNDREHYDALKESITNM